MALKHHLSFQLYNARDFPPVAPQLVELAKLGFTNVETFSALYQDPPALKLHLDANGLTAFSGHFDLLFLERDTKAAIEIAGILGLEVIVAPWLAPEHRPTDAQGWKAVGKRLSALHEKLAPHKLRLAWHNHDFEFKTLQDGTLPISHILDDNAVELEIDVAWIVRAGQDPIFWLKHYSDRIPIIHVKDLARPGQDPWQEGWASLGDGLLDWASLFPAFLKTGAEALVLEHDRPANWLSYARDSAAALQHLFDRHGKA